MIISRFDLFFKLIATINGKINHILISFATRCPSLSSLIYYGLDDEFPDTFGCIVKTNMEIYIS